MLLCVAVCLFGVNPSTLEQVVGVTVTAGGVEHINGLVGISTLVVIAAGLG